ncbi:MAG: hypothetical protein ACRD1Z_21980 [Vicinamibacteria bacterium]
MSSEQFYSLLVAILTNTAGLIWRAATMHATVKQHGRELLDHEERLREGGL